MSVRFDRGGWEVRWRDGSGRKRAKRFKDEAAALAFDDALGEVTPAERRADTAVHGSQGNVYPYSTPRGTRWRFVARRSDGKQTSRRGFASPRAAREACRRFVEQIDREEVRHAKQTFAGWWDGWPKRRKPYLEPNAWRAYDVDGRKRLVPAFGDVRLDRLSTELVRSWRDEQAEAVEAGDYAAKTINNTLGTLVVCLNAAARDRDARV